MKELAQHYYSLGSRSKTANFRRLEGIAKRVSKSLRTPISQLSTKEKVLGGLGSLGAIAAAKGLMPELGHIASPNLLKFLPEESLALGAKNMASDAAYLKSLGKEMVLPAGGMSKQVSPSYLNQLMAKSRIGDVASSTLKDAKGLVSRRFADSSILDNPVIKSKLPNLKELLYNDYIAGSSLAISPGKAIPYAGILADLGDVANQATMLKHLNQVPLPANIKNVVSNPNLLGLAKKPVSDFYNPLLKSLGSKGSNLRTALAGKSENLAALLQKQQGLPFPSRVDPNSMLVKELGLFNKSLAKDVAGADAALSKGFRVPTRRHLDEVKRIAQAEGYIPWQSTSSITGNAMGGVTDLAGEAISDSAIEEVINQIITKKAPGLLAQTSAKEVPLLGQAIGAIGAAADTKGASELQKAITMIREAAGAQPASWTNLEAIAPGLKALKSTGVDIKKAIESLRSKELLRTVPEASQSRATLMDML